MSESKYTTQTKNLRKNYVRFPLDLKPELLDAFKAACAQKGTTPAAEIKKFIVSYTKQNTALEDCVEIEVELPLHLAQAAETQNLDLSAVLVESLCSVLGLDE